MNLDSSSSQLFPIEQGGQVGRDIMVFIHSVLERGLYLGAHYQILFFLKKER